MALSVTVAMAVVVAFAFAVTVDFALAGRLAAFLGSFALPAGFGFPRFFWAIDGVGRLFDPPFARVFDRSGRRRLPGAARRFGSHRSGDRFRGRSGRLRRGGRRRHGSRSWSRSRRRLRASGRPLGDCGADPAGRARRGRRRRRLPGAGPRTLRGAFRGAFDRRLCPGRPRSSGGGDRCRCLAPPGRHRPGLGQRLLTGRARGQRRLVEQREAGKGKEGDQRQAGGGGEPEQGETGRPDSFRQPLSDQARPPDRREMKVSKNGVHQFVNRPLGERQERLE